LKAVHAAAGMARLPVERGRERDVSCGSHASWLGDRRAFKFWEIVSSTALRDIRRKSGRCVRGCSERKWKNAYPVERCD
jgi:hypothetical protein